MTELGLDPADAGGQALWGEKDLEAVEVTGAAGAGDDGRTILANVFVGLALGWDVVEPQLLSGAPGDGLYIGLLLSGDATVLGRTFGIVEGILNSL